MKIVTRAVFSPRRLGALTAIAAAIGAVNSPHALAQQEQLVLEEITVTARKREESMQSIPLAVTAFSGEDLERWMMRDIREMEGRIPNVVIDSVTGAAPGAGAFFIRGVGTQEVEKSFDPAVGIVIDGVAVSIVNGTLVNSFDFAYVEVLRGPQGTLFGKNTTGGVVNIRRTKPTGELGLRYEVTADDNDRLDVKGIVNFPIVKDKLAGKISYLSMQDGSRVELFTYQDFDDESDGFPSFNIASAAELPCAIAGFCGPPDSDLDEVNIDFYFPIDYELEAYTLEMNWEIAGGTLTSITGYRDTFDDTFIDFDATPLSFFHVQREQSQDQTSQELRYVSNDDFSENWNFVTGVYWMEDEYDLKQVNNLLEFLGPALQITGGNITNHTRESWAIFGEVAIDLGERWTLTVGGRYTEEEKEYTGTLLAILPDGTEITPIQSSVDEDWNEFTPRIGLDYQWNEDLMLYAIYSEGFRSGGFNARNAVPGTLGPYDPEYVDQFEIGMKSDLLDGKMRLNLAAFYTDYTDKQEEFIRVNAIQGSVTIVENAGEVTTQGLEAELTWLLTPNLTVGGNLGYLDAEYDEFMADGNDDGVVDDLSGLELRRTPDWTGGIYANYAVPLGSGTFGIDAGYRYTDEYYVDAGNDPRGLLDSRGIVDLVVHYTFEWGDSNTLRISAYGRDITDERDTNSAVIVPGLIAFAAADGGEEYGISISGSF
jgi:iron complex outermembrane receptor protein